MRLGQQPYPNRAGDNGYTLEVDVWDTPIDEFVGPQQDFGPAVPRPAFPWWLLLLAVVVLSSKRK